MSRTSNADYIVEGDAAAGVQPSINPLAIGLVDASGLVRHALADADGHLLTGVAGKAITLLGSTTDAVAHTVTAAPVTGLDCFKQAGILLNVTAAGTAAGDTLDVFIDTSPDGGTTWINTVHFNQVLGNGGAKQYAAVIDPAGAAGTSTVDVSSDAAAGVVRPSIFYDRLRVRYTITDGGSATQSFTFSVSAYVKG